MQLARAALVTCAIRVVVTSDLILSSFLPCSWKQAGVKVNVSDLGFYAPQIGNLLQTFRDNLYFLFFKGQAVQEGADRMSRNVGDKVAAYAA